MAILVQQYTEGAVFYFVFKIHDVIAGSFGAHEKKFDIRSSFSLLPLGIRQKKDECAHQNKKKVPRSTAKRIKHYQQHTLLSCTVRGRGRFDRKAANWPSPIPHNSAASITVVWNSVMTCCAERCEMFDSSKHFPKRRLKVALTAFKASDNGGPCTNHQSTKKSVKKNLCEVTLQPAPGPRLRLRRRLRLRNRRRLRPVGPALVLRVLAQ